MTTKKYTLKNSPSAARPLEVDYSAELNAEQYEVVTSADGPCLVLAGAGSGKTRTLIYRVAYLLEKGARPDEILLVTFTNKAASQMRDRVEVLLKSKAKGLWCGTFHHIGNRTLRMRGKAIGLADDFGILDEEDSRDLIKACARSVQPADGARFPKPSVIQNVISFAANSREALSDVVARRFSYLAPFTPVLERIRALYEEKKQKTRNLDYDDLLLKWIALLKAPGAENEAFAGRFRYVLVDEYQDTNRLQHEIIRLVAARHGNVLVVGDDAQSIYSFRAARIRNILDFPKEWPGCRVFKLETNYRSTRPILELANQSIRNNAEQFPKRLRSVVEDGTLPQLVKLRDTRQEAAFVAQRLLEMHSQGTPLTEIAVLFRARFQAAELEMELAKRGVPYVIRGGVRFFEQAHIKDVLAYLRILQNPLDELAWTRALTLEPGIGGGYAERIFDRVEKAGAKLADIAESAFGAELPPRVREGFGSFKRKLRVLLKEGETAKPDALVERVLESGYDKYALMNFDNAQDRLEDLKELVNFAHTYRSLKEFLADVTLRESFKGESLAADAAGAPDEPEEELVLSTIHQAKGLEWSAVFVIGLSEGQFPHARSMQSQEELEEERRLFYVASTRAKRELVLTHPITRFDYSAGTVICRPSVFVQELPPDAYDEVEVEEREEEETIYLE